LAKWALVFFLAAFCDNYSDSIKLYWKRFVPICLLAAAVVGLVIVEDFGTAAFIALLSFLMLIIAGVKWWHILTPLPFGVIAFCAALFRSPTRLQRIAAFLNPQKWADSTAYQANQSLIALGSGGLWGKGLGRGICKYGHLPEDTTDFIFAIIGEELGFIGNAAVIGLFIVFVWLGILVIVRCRDRFGRLLAGGIVLTIGIQAAFNIGVVTVVLPTKGIPLPFVSAGGTGMLLSAAAVGVLLNIAKQSTQTAVREKE
jgi:cell division protein FtsW